MNNRNPYRMAAQPEDEVVVLRRKLQAAEVCYKDTLDRLHGARNAALEEAAKVCDAYAEDKWNLYNGHAPYTGIEDGRADVGVQGESSGADDCAIAIRELKDKPCTDHQ